MRRSRRRIRNKAGEHTIRNLSCVKVARIVRRKLFYLIFTSHPRLKLPGVHDHVPNPVTPTAVSLAIKDDVRDRGFADLSLPKCLKDYRPDQIVTSLGTLVESGVILFGKRRCHIRRRLFLELFGLRSGLI